ncbi:MFS transporter [Muribacter muris]|uniref:MFS transporter n=1 Tax=Muribacter muris TaxID=67855 RepID=A0A4Y9K8T9_9PAST|nr:MFS transporter [Muribacter muris]MBF0784083.1 MFS transporter [Muribacter muris]MBF0827578.1 MFS transporter [Muribacter muris]TFV13137.1 MFS transporter [Muribacter muris]
MNTSQLNVITNPPQDNRRMRLLLCSAVFLLVSGTGIIAPLLAPYASSMGISAYAIGFLFSGFYIVRLIIGTPVGFFSEKYGSRKTLIVSLIVYPFVSLSYFFANDVLSLLSARLLHGIASAMMLPMAMAYMGNISLRGKEGYYIGILNTVILTAGAFGPVVGGFIAQYWGIRIAFSCLFFLSLISLMIAIFLPRDHSPQDILESEEIKKKEHVVKLRLNRNIVVLALFNIIIAIFDIFIISFFPLYTLKMQLSAPILGGLIAANSLIMAGLQIPFGRLVDRKSKRISILVSVVGMCLSLLLTPLITGFSVWVGFFFFISTTAISSALCMAGVSALSVETGKQEGMGRIMGFLGSASSFGMVIGPMLSAFLIDHVSYESIFYVTAAIWFLTGIIFVSTTRGIRHYHRT